MMIFSYILYFVFFFFSSRRRHTRYRRDWSSDVCSSDLQRRLEEPPMTITTTLRPLTELDRRENDGIVVALLWSRDDGRVLVAVTDSGSGVSFTRSEERRVGKECRSRWSPYH